MGGLNTIIVEKLQDFLNSKIIPENSLEHYHAKEYLQHLLSTNTDLDILEKALVRFYRIRPTAFNQIKSPVSSIYNELLKIKILSITPQTDEEKSLSIFLTTLFAQSSSFKQHEDALIYKIVANVEPGIKNLNQYVPSFSWDDPLPLVKVTLLHTAVQSSDLDLVKLLVAAGANVNAIDIFCNTVLYVALYKGNEKITFEIISHPELVVSDNYCTERLRMLFAGAITKNDITLAKAILSMNNLYQDKIISLVNDDGETLLTLAALDGNETITKMLLDAGADPGYRNADKNSALSIIAGLSRNAFKPQHLKIATLLIEKMPPKYVNAATKDRKTALQWAVEGKNQSIIQLLEQYNKNANAPSAVNNVLSFGSAPSSPNKSASSPSQKAGNTQ